MEITLFSSPHSTSAPHDELFWGIFSHASHVTIQIVDVTEDSGHFHGDVSQHS
jgi:hypothetical protein